MILNNAPIRTSRNYGINNIKVENINIPENIESFDGLNLSGDLDSVKIGKNEKYSPIKYGNNEILSKQIEKQANVNLEISIESKMKEALKLDFNLSKKNKNLVDNILIKAKSNTRGTIIIRYFSEKDDECYHNCQIKVLAQKGSKLNIILLNLLNYNTQHYVSIENILEEKAKIEYVMADFGGKNSITNYYSSLDGDEAESNVNTIYLGSKEQILDLNYITNVYGKSAKTNMNVKGAITDNARKHFKGTIDFKRGCKKAKGEEDEYCTILSNTAKSISLPMLLCTEEDVEGNHAAAAGRIDSNQLFYLMARGFDEKEAQKLLVRAQFNEIIESIGLEEIKSQILEEIERKL